MTVLQFVPRRAADGIPGDLGTLSAAWLSQIAARGACRRTVEAYRGDVQRLAAFAERHGVTLVQLLSERLVERWIDDGLLHLGWGLRTASRRLTAVRMFLRWCRREAYLDHDPTSTIRLRFRAKRVIAPELSPLKGVIARIGTRAPLDLRDRAILLLLLDGALRASEVCHLDEGADALYRVDTPRCQATVPAKGDATGEAPETVGLEDATCAAVEAWRRKRPAIAREGEPATFVNTRGARLSRQSLYTMVRARGAAAGLPQLHPHLFRHRRIGDVVEKLGLDVGCALARHKHKSTTANTYGAHAAEVQRAAIRRLAPLGDIA